MLRTSHGVSRMYPLRTCPRERAVILVARVGDCPRTRGPFQTQALSRAPRRRRGTRRPVKRDGREVKSYPGDLPPAGRNSNPRSVYSREAVVRPKNCDREIVAVGTGSFTTHGTTYVNRERTYVPLASSQVTAAARSSVPFRLAHSRAQFASAYYSHLVVTRYPLFSPSRYDLLVDR